MRVAMIETIDWIVVPGGPGLSADYLRKPLERSFVDYALYFYAPLGSPGADNNTSPTIE